VDKVTILVGNGLNFFLANYVGKEKYEDEIVEKWKKYGRDGKKLGKDMLSDHVRQLHNDISKYCGLLDFIKLADHEKTDTPNESEKGETLLARLEGFIEPSTKDGKEIIQKIEHQVKKKIKRIFVKGPFRKGEPSFLQLNNAKIKFVFGDIANKEKTYFSEKLNDLVTNHGCASDYHVFTTNYDYTPNSLFKERYRTTSVDGVEVHYLHGHYDDDRLKKLEDHEGYGKIICCAPNSKKSRIKEDPKSNEAFKTFKTELDLATIVILFGIGLTSDPHIRDELNKKKGHTFIIIGSDSDTYMQNHFPNKNDEKGIKFEFLENNDIYFIDTAKPTISRTFIGAGINKVEPVETPEQLLSSLGHILEHIQESRTN